MADESNRGAREGTPGWQQFLANKAEMLAAYDLARTQSRIHQVEVAHGLSGEAMLRRWLRTFLPTRYGVTKGFIVSQRMPGVSWGPPQKLPEFDVIIYDQLDCPILWTEGNPDLSESGGRRAVPVEHVRGILEVKASLDPESASKAIKHLSELRTFWETGESEDARHPVFLRRNAFCGVVFFELRKEHEFSAAALDGLLAPYVIRSQYIGGLILRGEGLDPDVSGRIKPHYPDAGVDSNVDHRTGLSLLSSKALSTAVGWTMSTYGGLKVTWDHDCFAEFAFDLLAFVRCPSARAHPRRGLDFRGVQLIGASVA